MSKDTNNNFAKHFLETNEMFAEAARVLQEQIDKIGIRLGGLEKDLKNARSQLKNKDLEILRLKEIIKTYGSNGSNSNFDLRTQLRQVIDEVKDLSVSIKTNPSSSAQDDNSSAMSNVSESSLFKELQKNYNDVLIVKDSLERRVQELEREQAKNEESIDIDAGNIASLKDEVSKYVQENISLQEKIDSIENLERKNASQDEELNNLKKILDETQEENNLLQKTMAYKEEREKELLFSLDHLQQEHDLLQKTVNMKEDKEKELLQSVDELQQEHDLLEKTVNIKEEKEKELFASVDELQKEHDLLEKTVNIKEEREKELLKSVDDLQQEHDLLEKTVNIKEGREKELLVTIHSLEQKIEVLIQEKSTLLTQINDYKNQIGDLEEEILTVKLEANQLADDTENSMTFEEETMNLSKMEEKDPFDSSKDELLLKISELEMEEANWKDEKTILLSKLHDLEVSQKIDSPGEAIDNRKDSIIKSLKGEILELNQDLDTADAEIKELEIENKLLKDKFDQVDPTTIEPKSSIPSESLLENEQIVYEIKQKDSLIDEYLIRLKSQEQKISHLEALMDQERELKEKFEFLYNNTKEKLEGNLSIQAGDSTEARKRFEQVVRSLNRNSKAFDLTTNEDEDDGESGTSKSADDLGKALENANLYVSLIDKFLKPHVQVSQLLKQGTWEINSLAEIVGIERKTLMEILQELKAKNLVNFDTTNVWLIS